MLVIVIVIGVLAILVLNVLTFLKVDKKCQEKYSVKISPFPSNWCGCVGSRAVLG